MNFDYSLKYPMDMNTGDVGRFASAEVKTTSSPNSIFNKTQFNTYATTSAGGGSGRRQYVAANDPEKHFNALKAMSNKGISLSNYHLLDLDGDGAITQYELLALLPLLVKEAELRDFTSTVHSASYHENNQYWSYEDIQEMISDLSPYSDGVVLHTNKDGSIQEIPSKSAPGATLLDVLGLASCGAKSNGRLVQSQEFKIITSPTVNKSKIDYILGDKDVVTSVDLLRIFAWCKNITLPAGKKDLFESIPADFSLDREKFDEIITFYCSDPFDLGGFLKACDKADPYREADKPRNVSTPSTPAPSRPSTPAPSTPSTPAPSRPNTPRAQNSGKLVPLDADDPKGNQRRIRGLVMTGDYGASAYSSDNFDVSNNGYIDGFELLGLNDKEITAALKAHPNFAMSKNDFKTLCGGSALIKGTREYSTFKRNLLAKINASGTEQNSRCSDLIKIRESGIITNQNIEAIDVNRDGWIEASEFAMAGIDIKGKYKSVATMAKLKEEVKAKRQVNIQNFFDNFAIDSSQINPNAKKTGNIYE